MTSIPVAIYRYSGNNFKRFYLKKKTVRGFFIAFQKCAWNLEYSERKEEYPSLNNTEIISSERDVYLSV